MLSRMLRHWLHRKQERPTPAMATLGSAQAHRLTPAGHTYQNTLAHRRQVILRLSPR